MNNEEAGWAVPPAAISWAAGKDSPVADEARAIIKSIRRITRAIDTRSKAVTRAVGLTIPQIVLLHGVRDLGEVTTNVLARHADLSAATVVAILDKLEARGLVERYRSRIDRRIVHTRLTAAGHATLDKAPPLFAESFLTALETVPGPARSQILAAFDQVATMMEIPRAMPPRNETALASE